MIKKILIAVAVLIAGFCVVAAMQPADFRIVRTTTISAPQEAVFGLVNDFHQWEKWSPWAKMDPSMKTTYSGAPSGVGSSYAWEGNSQVGSGQMTLVENHVADRVGIKLEFLKPMPASNMAVFTFKPEGSATAVTWEMTGVNGFMGKAFGLIMNIDKLVGADFEKGLAQMKAVAESAPKQ